MPRGELVHYQRARDDSWSMRVIASEGTTTLAIGATLDLRALCRMVPEIA